MALAAVVTLLAAHNIAGNLWLPERWYVPVNLLTALAVVAIAGVSTGDLGLADDALAHGTLVGGAGAVIVALAIVALATWPVTRPLAADRRMSGVGRGETAWRALVRIPLGTVVLEEVAFRGVVPALVDGSGAAGVAVASGLFGLWHVIPTTKVLDVNSLVPGGPSRALALVGAVGLTAAVGVAFCGLRLWSGSLLAPVLVHVAANSTATVAAYRVLRGRSVRSVNAAASGPPPP